MSYTMYTPLNVWLDPASVTDVVAYIQTYLSNNPIYSTAEIEALINDYLVAHPELIGVQSVNGKTGTVVLSASDINTENDITIESALAALSSQISSIAANVTTNANNITGLTGRMTTAETNITGLTGRVSTAETNISNLNSHVNLLRNSVPEYDAILNFASHKFSDGAAQGFCFLGTNKYVVAKTTGTDSDNTTYSVFSVNTLNYVGTLLASTQLSTLHSNSLAYNSDTGEIVCVTNNKIFVMEIDSDNVMTITNTIDTTTAFSGVTYLNGVYYLYGENYIWSTSDFSTFNQLFKVDFAPYASQGLATDGTYLYHCTSGNQYNVIWVYTTVGVLVRTILITAEYGELEEIDFYNNVMYSNVNESEGSGVFVTPIDNSVMSPPNINLSPNSVSSVNITNAVNANRWCGIFAVNGSSTDTQGAWLVMGYGAGVGRFSVTPIKSATKISVTINGTAIEVENTSTVTPKLFIQWIVPPVNGITITST